MEGDKTADNDKELTSTSSSVMNKLLSTNKEEKSDSNDTLPTSSTDASTSTKSARSVSDDPISSTSSEMDISKSKPNDNLSANVVDKASSNFDTEAELLGMSITTQPCEKIEENVDDLVNDLETLLGESTDNFILSSKSTSTKKEKTNVTSAIREAVHLSEYKSEYEVSSNTVTTEKIEITKIIENREDKNDENIENTQESGLITDVTEGKMTNVNTTNLSESSSEIGEIHKHGVQENKEELLSNQDSIKNSDCACSVKQPDEVRQEIEQDEEVSNAEKGMKHETTQNIKSEIKATKKDNLHSFNVQKLTDEQSDSTTELKKDIVITKPDVREVKSNEREGLCGDAAGQAHSLSVGHTEYRENVTVVKADQVAEETVGNLKNIEITEVGKSLINDTNNVQKEETQSNLKGNVCEEFAKTEKAYELVEEYEENKNMIIEVACKDSENNLNDNEEKRENADVAEEICSEEKKIILVESTNNRESNVFASVGIEHMEKNNFISEELLIQKVAEEDVEAGKGQSKQLGNNKDEVKIEDKNNSMDALEIQGKEEEKEKEVEQIINIIQQENITPQDTAKDVKEIISENLKDQSVESVVDLNEATAEKDKHGNNESFESASVVESGEIKVRCEEVKHIDFDSMTEIMDVNSTEEIKVNKDGYLQNIDVHEEKQDELEVVDNVSENIVKCAHTSDDTKTMQNLEEIEITELPDNIADESSGNVEVISVDPVIVEPEETFKRKDTEQQQDSNIEEICEEETVKDHLEEPRDVVDLIASDRDQSEVKEVIKSDTPKENADKGTKLSVDIENHLENEAKKLDTIEPSKDEITVDKETTNNEGNFMANVIIQTDDPVIEKIEKIVETVPNINNIEINEADICTSFEGLSDKIYPLTEEVDMQDTPKVAEICRVEESIDKVVNVNDTLESLPLMNIIKGEKSASQGIDITATDSRENQEEFAVASETSILPQERGTVVDVKPVSEINIRRKTVEQDLEKVVCLSEESSDSDTNDPLVSLPKLSEDVSSFHEASNLIKIAGEVDQFPDSELPSEETMPVIEDILSVEPQVISSVASVDSSSNLETILAVASLQNESVSDVVVERRLSEKEIREMEAIRMAVASITDNSSDTYNYMIDNSVTLNNSMEEISNAEELPREVSQILSEPEIPSEIIGENEATFDNSSGGVQEHIAEKIEMLPENDNRTEVSILGLGCDKKTSNSSQNKTDVTTASDQDNSAGDKMTCAEGCEENVQLILKSESSDVINNAVDNSNTTANEIVEKCEVQLETKTRKDTEKQIAVGIQKNEVYSVGDQNLAKRNELSVKGLSENEVALPNKVLEENVNPVSERTVEKTITVEVEAIDRINTEENVIKESEINFSRENYAQNNILLSEKVVEISKNIVAEENKAAVQKPSTEEENVLEDSQEGKNVAPAVDQIVEERPLRSRTRRGNKLSEPLSINIEEVDKKEKVYSPKITIKPVKVPDEEVSTTSDAEGNKGSLKMTITKQSDKMHSILKVFNPEDDVETPQVQEEPIPKLIIKPKIQQVEQQHSPKMTTRSSKAYSPTSTRCSSPRVTIKPVTKPTDTKCESLSPLKITFKPVVKLEEGIKKQSPKMLKEQDQKNHNPKITIKPIPKPPETEKEETTTTCTPKVTIKPIKRHLEESEADNEQERSSPKITIKPVVKPIEQDPELVSNQMAPKLKIKPIKKHDDEEISGPDKEQGSPKMSIKPVVKTPELEEEDEIKQRIVLKINKGNLPTPTKDPKKREYPDDEKSEKIGIKLKFSTTGGHTHIIQEKEESNKRQRKDSGYSGGLVKKDLEEPSHKRLLEEKFAEKNKRLRSTPDKLNEHGSDDIKNVNLTVESPISLSEDSRSQHSGDCLVVEDSNAACADISKIVDIASRTTHIEATPALTVGIATPTVTPAPKRRGRPRKVPLEIREELRDPPTTPNISSQVTPQNIPAVQAASTPESNVGTTPSPGGRPKRSCRGQNVIATLGIKPRKPRGRGRGSKVNMGDREPPTPQTPAEPVQTVPMKPEKETKISKAKLKLMQKSAEEEIQKQKELEVANKALQEKLGTTDKKDEGNPKKISLTTPELSTSAGVEKGNPIPNPEIGPSSSAATTIGTIGAISDENFTDLKAKDQFEGGFRGKNDSPRVAEKLEESTTEKKQRIDLKVEERQVGSGEKKAEENPNFEGYKKEESLTGEASADEEADSGEDSEIERRREKVLLKKQEAIKKCRAKRMEKLARAAELKKKRQEQAAQQREARKAAEEAEKAASDRARATKRYGRYGVPKPQISLIDAPVEETAGTIKSHRGLFDPETERVNITQPILIDDDINFDKERVEPLKHIGGQPMVVDSADDAQTKIRRSLGTEDVVMLDEETRMSADFRGSRAQTPAKQAVPLPDIMVEDSQGSMGTEGGKSRSSKTPKMEVFQDLESTIFTADQLAEYSWNGQGPFMLQEQVAQYLGIKSFKRKYPQIARRPVDMQERDYLKENGLATEAQCDLGLTAVIAQDILDIMYTDFQDKYEDYCRCQREKQARELANKQKALNQFTLKPGFDKLDILEQAVQSAAAWNQQFNKERREQRKAHMDLQSLIVHYPKSKMKVVPSPKIGHYPVALVPGQFTDHYQEFTPTELNNLPLNTMCYDEIKIAGVETDSENSSSGSDSESESSSGSSSSDSSCDDEDCKECIKVEKSDINCVRETDSDDVVIIENDASSSDSVVLVSVTSAPVTA